MSRLTICRVFRLAFVVITLFLSLAIRTGAIPDQHSFAWDDFAALRRARAIAVSPDGKTVLYEVSFDGDKGPTKHEWRLSDTFGENSRKLTLPEAFEPSGFTKDGAALFGFYEVDKKRQLGIVPLSGAAPTRIIALTKGVRQILIAPDGNRFAFTADPRPIDPLADLRHVIENDVTSIYVAAEDGSGSSWWCPDLKDVASLAWSADSSQLAVVTQSQKIGHHDMRSLLWVCSSSGARKVAEIPNAVSGIAWANSGKDLAFASTTTDVLTPDHLWTVPVSGGVPQDQTPKLDGSITNVRNDPHGTVWAEMHKGTIVEIYSYRDGKLSPAYHWPGGILYSAPVDSYFTSSP